MKTELLRTIRRNLALTGHPIKGFWARKVTLDVARAVCTDMEG